jgi:hypothetical protein
VLLTEQTVGVGNTATVAGGFISAEGYAQAEIFDAMFDQNSVVLDKLGSAGWGGFAAATENAVIAITNTTIEGHVSQLGVSGGAIFINKNASLSLSMSMLSHYHTSSQGCGVSMHHNSTFVAYDTTLADLASGTNGGGLLMDGSCQGCLCAFGEQQVCQKCCRWLWWCNVDWQRHCYSS